MNDAIINKVQIIQRHIMRAREIYGADSVGFATNTLHQDAAIFNVLRACEAAIDLASYVIRTRKLGIPCSSAESFLLLRDAGLIDASLAERLGKLIGFRNVAVHQYVEIDANIVEAVIVRELDELLAFGDWMVELARNPMENACNPARDR